MPASSNQATLYHTGNTTYRCFLPDLTGFIVSSCIEPDYQHRLAKTNLAGREPQTGIQPRYSGFRVQGTASSPPSTAQFMMLPTSVYQVNIRIIGIRPFAEFTLSVIRFFASLRMTLLSCHCEARQCRSNLVKGSEIATPRQVEARNDKSRRTRNDISGCY